MAGADLWIEAVPVRLSLKREVFEWMDGLAEEAALLATNTSTLSVTELATFTSRPARVMGMHFFNPAAVMPLVEIVRGAENDEAALAVAVTAAEELGKTPLVVSDSPGFIVNRVARPFYGEALRILGEGDADLSTIDAAVTSVGFPMGPFQLMDWIGIDVNLAASRSVYEQMFHEPRFRPHPLQQRKVVAGQLGRKSGRGFYRYGEDGAPEGALALDVPEAGGEGALWVVGSGWDRGCRNRLRGAGFALVDEGCRGAGRAGFGKRGREATSGACSCRCRAGAGLAPLLSGE